jgi:hypothetical protein
MKLKIKVTKEILRRSAMCGEGIHGPYYAMHVHSNCAISLACQELLPGCSVSRMAISSHFSLADSNWSIFLPYEAAKFIWDFDKSSPSDRVFMPEFEFEVELNKEVLAAINIDEAMETLKNSSTLELIEV